MCIKFRKNQLTQFFFETRDAAQASQISSEVHYIITGGRSTVGIGQASYVQVMTMPSHDLSFKSADGRFWEIADCEITPEMAGCIGDGKANDTMNLEAALKAAQVLGRPLRLRRIYLIDNRITIDLDHGPLAIFGDGAGLGRIIRTTGGDTGALKFKGTINTHYLAPMLRIEGVEINPLGCVGGAAIDLEFVGGSGNAPLGPRIHNTIIRARDAESFFETGIRGTNVRDADFSGNWIQGPANYGVVVGGTGNWLYGFDFTGDSDPVVHHHTNDIVEFVQTAARYDGTHEGVYFFGCEFDFCKNGLVFRTTGSATVEPDVKFNNGYLNVRNVGLDIDNVSDFQCRGTSISPDGAVGGTGDFIAIQYNQSNGGFISKCDLDGTHIYGLGAMRFDPWNQMGIYFKAGNQVFVGMVIGYGLDIGIKTDSGVNINPGQCFFFGPIPKPFLYDANTAITLASPALFVAVDGNGVTQKVGHNSLVVLKFNRMNTYYGPPGLYDALTGEFALPASIYEFEFSVHAIGRWKAKQLVYVSIFDGPTERERVLHQVTADQEEIAISGTKIFNVLNVDPVTQRAKVTFRVYQNSGDEVTIDGEPYRASFKVRGIQS